MSESEAEKLRIAKADNYFAQQADQIEEDRRKALADKGYEDAFQLPEGETKLAVLKVIPASRTTRYGEVRVYRIVLAGDTKERDLMVGINSPLRRDIVNRLAEVSADRAHMRIVRVGTKQQTRYSVLDAE